MIGVPSAWMMELLFASLAKRLLEGKITVAERLQYLEYLADCGGHYGPAVVAAIQPADNTTQAIVAEALKLSDGRDDHGAAFFAVLERAEVLADLLRLNPSLATAAGLCTGRKAA